jgi:hypothetical protein
MNFRPDHLFIQFFALNYFCSWLWLGVSTGIVPVRDIARRPIAIAVGIVLIGNAAIWVYLAALILMAGASPFHLAVTIDLGLIVAMATAYFPLKPWSSHPATSDANFVRMGRIELAVLVIGLPIGSLFVDSSFVTEFLEWFRPVIEMYPVITCLTVGLAICWLIASKPPQRRVYLLLVGVVLIALVTTYLMTFTVELVAVSLDLTSEPAPQAERGVNLG